MPSNLIYFGKRTLLLAASLAAMSSLASGYYYWAYFPARNGPFVPVPARFDLTALPNNTVSFFISDQNPAPLMPGDSLTAIDSEIQQAASVWNNVGSSAIRLRFGGISTVGTPQSTPGIDIVFDDDMPPGIIAQTKPTTVSDLSFLTKGASFVPILRSRLQLRHNLTTPYQQASYTDGFFLTLVHEFGHTLGLQHTLTSGVMSTAITRATTKAAPLSPDDIAGISTLYPKGTFLAGTGSILGQVTLAGAAGVNVASGVNLASVVALSSSGVAISGMTNPDGTYLINAIPPGQYYVYVHPVPPAQQGEATPANIVFPVDPTSQPFPANTGFTTQFFPGTQDWTQATQITVTAGNSVALVNFTVQPRPGPAVYDMETYAYQGSNGSVPAAAPRLQSGTREDLAFFADGAAVNNSIAPGLNVSVIGGTAQIEAGTLTYWTQGFLYMVVDANQVSAPAPTALAVNLNNDLYVLPAAFTVVPSAPPAISSVAENTSARAGSPLTATVAGANLSASTQILFDGAPANILQVNADGSLVVSEPAAPAGYQATVEALNPDGQTSSQALGSAMPATLTYDAANTPWMSVTPAVLGAGTHAMVTINGFNTNFASGKTVAGFGSSDVVVRQAWVVNPGELLLDISISPAAQLNLATVTVSTDLQTITLPGGFQVTAANPQQVSLLTPILNQATGLAGTPVGGTVTISTSGLPPGAAQNLSGWTLSIGGQNVRFSVSANGQITTTVPALSLGPAVVQLSSPSGGNIPPVVLQVDPPPPSIVALISSPGAAIDANHPAHPGDTIQLIVTGLTTDPSAPPTASSVQITVGGVDCPVTSVGASTQSGGTLVQFVLPMNVPVTAPGTSPALLPAVVVSQGTLVSAGAPLVIQVPAS